MTLFKEEDTPFVMELPPYRRPTVKSIITHMWDRSSQYLKKMGGPILIASIVIWFLGYFPREGSWSEDIDKQVAQAEMQFQNNEINTEQHQLLLSEIEYFKNTEHQKPSY